VKDREGRNIRGKKIGEEHIPAMNIPASFFSFKTRRDMYLR
jgi:hypothetical protein